MSKTASQQALSKAKALGRKMSKKERHLQPVLVNAHHCRSYLRFIIGHRFLLEGMPEFARWNANLCRLVEAEHSRQESPDAVRSNEAFYEVQAQIRCAFWYGWETAVELPRLYGEERISVRRSDRPKVLHVYRPAEEETPLDGCQPPQTARASTRTLDRLPAALAGPDPDALLQVGNEDFPVADLAAVMAGRL